MYCTADYYSKKYNNVNYIFRINTKLISPAGEGKVLGLVYMLNPGSSRPIEINTKNKLENTESKFFGIRTIIDPTLASVIKLLNHGSQIGKLNIDGKYTIHIENLFNICDDQNKRYDAFEAVEELKDIDEISNLSKYNRHYDDYNYKFVWLAWGNTDYFKDKRVEIISKYPNSIQIKKRNHKGKTININYPHHPLYLGVELFEEFLKIP